MYIIKLPVALSHFDTILTIFLGGIDFDII
jgi:hypothetical protein